MIPDFNRTIAAPASGTGGAVSLIRLSGKDALAIVEKVFRMARQKDIQPDTASTDKNDRKKGRHSDLGNVRGFSIVYGDIIDGDEIIDDVLLSVFRAPNSYTGENSVEISCHASPYIQSRILQLLADKGAFPARPGEFTQRAFINGKMDLAQAEAVADIINSETRAAHRLAMNQMRGVYSREIKELRQKMLHFASMIELELDFGEEDVEFADRYELKSVLEEIKTYTDSLRDSFKYGNALKKGVPVAIVGRPNVGKSSLLNALLKDDKAIVSEIPGTTRDIVEDTIVIEGVLFRFIDTAGLRETADVIENLGIRKTYQKIGQADLVLLLADAADDATAINRSYQEISKQVEGTDKTLLLVINKTDLLSREDLNHLDSQLDLSKNSRLMISAVSGDGVDTLILKLTGIINSLGPGSGQLAVTNLRHYQALGDCSESLERALEGLESGLPEDLVAMDLRQAIYHLGEITGEISTDEILTNIFSNFCIGK